MIAAEYGEKGWSCLRTPPLSLMPSARAEEFRRAALRLGFECADRLEAMSAGFIKMGGRLQSQFTAEARLGRPFQQNSRSARNQP